MKKMRRNKGHGRCDLNNAKKVLTIIASQLIGNDTLFNQVPNVIAIHSQKYNTVGLITNNCVHFRAIVNINDTDWILYDGQKNMNI